MTATSFFVLLVFGFLIFLIGFTVYAAIAPTFGWSIPQ